MVADPSISSIDYDEIAHILEQYDEALTPAELHGIMSGKLAADSRRTSATGATGLLHDLNFPASVTQTEGLMVQQLLSATLASYLRDDMGFELFMPPEQDADCPERVEALGAWVRGFIEGFSVVNNQTMSGASRDVSELLGHLMDIGEVDPDVQGSEEDEKSLTELREFVRVAALNLFTELNPDPLGQKEENKSDTHKPGPEQLFH